MTDMENRLRAARFENPEHIPLTFHINSSCWEHYPQDDFLELINSHSLLFPGGMDVPGNIVYEPGARVGEPFIDAWGCAIETAENGIFGAVTRHPLADWQGFDEYIPPNPETDIDWEAVKRTFAEARRTGSFAPGSLQHGHTFLRLCDIRGYENALFDMMDNDPRIVRLLGMIEDYNAYLVKRHVELDVDWMGYPEDLGMQAGPMISPDLFRKYIKPCYKRLMAPAREAGFVVHMHSDGDLHDLVDDLIEVGVSALNLQDTVNGIDWIQSHLAGKLCIDLDIDRQNITRFGTPEQIDAHIRGAVEKLGSPQGGLMLLYGLYPGIPLENVKAVMDAMERYAAVD